MAIYVITSGGHNYQYQDSYYDDYRIEYILEGPENSREVIEAALSLYESECKKVDIEHQRQSDELGKKFESEHEAPKMPKSFEQVYPHYYKIIKDGHFNEKYIEADNVRQNYAALERNISMAINSYNDLKSDYIRKKLGKVEYPKLETFIPANFKIVEATFIDT